MPAAKALFVALAVDACFGEPPTALHPVVWMGRCLTWLEMRAPRDERARLWYGVLAGLGLPLAWGALGLVAERVAPWPLQAVLLKPAFAGRALLAASHRVEDALVKEDLVEARLALGSLVSRPTQHLDAGLVAAAAIESLAENLVDSWVAPLTAYACFGLGGCYAYRAANTSDAMWGYRTPAYESLGKGAARLDDVLNLLPARFGALLLICVGARRGAAVSAWQRDAHQTPSPNAGQSMAAIAGQLGVRLEKHGTYVLNASERVPVPSDVRAARGLVAAAMLACAVLSLVVSSARGKRAASNA